jgi:hypothetical protein
MRHSIVSKQNARRMAESIPVLSMHSLAALFLMPAPSQSLSDSAFSGSAARRVKVELESKAKFENESALHGNEWKRVAQCQAASSREEERDR